METQFDRVFFKLFNNINEKDFRLEIAGNETIDTRQKVYDEKFSDLNMILVSCKKFVGIEKMSKHRVKLNEVIMNSYKTYSKII